MRNGLYVVLVILGCIYAAIAINVAEIHWEQEQLVQPYEQQQTPTGVDQ